MKSNSIHFSDPIKKGSLKKCRKTTKKDLQSKSIETPFRRGLCLKDNHKETITTKIIQKHTIFFTCFPYPHINGILRGIFEFKKIDIYTFITPYGHFTIVFSYF